MLRELFPRGYARYEHSRFVRDLEDFGTWLKAIGYSRQCARGHLFRVRDSLERFARAKSQATHTVAQLEAVFGTRRIRTRRTMSYRATQRAYESFLLSRGRLAVVPDEVQFAELRYRYRQELLDGRGLSSETVVQHERTIGDFLSRTLSTGQSLELLTSADVDQYLALKGRVVCRHGCSTSSPIYVLSLDSAGRASRSICRSKSSIQYGFIATSYRLGRCPGRLSGNYCVP
jgi:integrase/recombinase XerD